LLVESLEEALEAKSAHPHARPIAGGADLMVAINAGTERPSAILDLSRVAELDHRERNGDTFIGAGVTYARVRRRGGRRPRARAGGANRRIAADPARCLCDDPVARLFRVSLIGRITDQPTNSRTSPPPRLHERAISTFRET
jgi:hypothetical protein